jgi:protein-S-isoprenylcysteine O-methyltransferase Ste14
LLDLFCVKFFFLPIMLCFLFSEGGAYFGAIQRLQDQFESGAWAHWNSALYTAALRAILLTDVAIGVIGYAGTSRWLYNKSKSVDPTMAGWVWALFCYPPFNHAASELFPFHSNLGAPYFSASWLRDFCGAVMLVCFAIYAWATVSFGVRFSNMTHRGIICHGPYAIVRHPAYVSKGIAWLAELLPKLANPWQVIGLLLFTGVYGLRGLTEEWHLRRDPAYREYCRKVPYRFVPGLF